MIAGPPQQSEILDYLLEGVYCLDRERRITFWNQGAERITGYRKVEVIGKRCADNFLCHMDTAGRNLCRSTCPAAAAMIDGACRAATVFLLHKDGYRKPVRIRVAPLLDDAGRIAGAIEVFADDTDHEHLRQRIAMLEKLTSIDPLTKVPNRRRLEQELETRLAELRRYGMGFGVLFADIDHFKHFNDAYGHLLGDQILCMVAQTVTRALRPFDLAGRWGGEEFLAVVANLALPDLTQVAERLRALIAQSRLRGKAQDLAVTVSVGAALADAADDNETLIQRVDRMLYRSKSGGRNRVTVAET